MKAFRLILCLTLAALMLFSCVLAAGASELEDWSANWEEIKTASDSISLTPGEDEGSISFCWLTKRRGGQRLLISESPDMSGAAELEVTTEPTAFARFRHTARAENLAPAASYYYTYTRDGSVSDVFSFKTPAEDGFTALFVSDAQIGRSGDYSDEVLLNDTYGWARTLEAATARAPQASLVLSAGDQAETAIDTYQYNALLAPAELRSLPVATALGNHDFYWPLNNLRFNNPNQQRQPLTRKLVSKGYFFACGDAVFIVLNSNNGVLLREHELLIEKALRAHPGAVWRVVMMHHTIYSAHSGDSVPSMRARFAPMFDRLGIDLVLSGHDHSYCRTEPIEDFKNSDGGVIYISAGSASGSNTHSEPDSAPWYMANPSSPDAPTYTLLDFTASAVSLETYRADTDTLIDSARAEKSGAEALPEMSAELADILFVLARDIFTALLSLVYH